MKTIGIFLAGQNGDILTASSVLKYRHELWPDSKIVWYMEKRNFDLLAHQDVELREFPRGFGYPEMVVEENRKLREAGKAPEWEDWAPLVDENNRLNLSLKRAYASLVDIDEGYFPAPHQMSVEKRHGLTYPECSRKVFGCEGREWHPVVLYTEEEKEDIREWVGIFEGPKVFIETFAGSGQSLLDQQMVAAIIQICWDKWGKCNFFFGSHKFLRGQEEFPVFIKARGGILDWMSIRSTGLVASYCDILLSVSSGITCAASAWGMNDPPILQFCGSETCGTRLLANGPFEMVTADGKTPEQYKAEYFSKLNQMLEQYEPFLKNPHGN